MSQAALDLEPTLLHYLRGINHPEADVLARLRQHTANHRLGKMAIAPEQAQLLGWLARLTGAKHYLELGVFTGYSSTAMALMLPEDGTVTACDINATFTDIARQTWQQAGIAHKITLHLQPALLTLQDLLATGYANHYDMALIDADKAPTPHYFEGCLKLVRAGGIIAIDNVLLHGRVWDEANAQQPPSVAILKAFNAGLAHDGRVTPITLPLGDGLTLLIKN